MKTALLTAIGSFSADAVIQSLKKQGIKIIGTDIYPKEWIVNAYSVDSFYQVPLGTNREKYLDAIQRICEENAVDYLLPLTDVEIDTLKDRRELFVHRGITLCISQEDAIDVCRNKLNTFQRLKNCGFDSVLIPTYSGIVYDTLEESLFPIICKPVNGRNSQGIKRFSSKEKLDFFFRSVNPEDYIIQPIVPGFVVTVDIVRSPKTGHAVAVPRKELLRTQSGAGTSVHVFCDDELVRLCVQIADALNVIGCVNFEFIQKSDGTYHFLECNPRFSGGVKFSCMTGYDFIQNHLNCFLGKDIDSAKPYLPCYIARKYEELVTSFE